MDEKRICREFAELVQIDAPSFGERRMADLLKQKLKALGFEVSEDDAGMHLGGTAGNLYGFLKGVLPGDPILLSAHMDTVEPACGKQAVFHEDGRITSNKETVLGADDVAGIVEILEAVRHVQEEGIPHRDIEVLFSVAEEVYIKGIRQFDMSRIQAKEAYVLDLSGTPGTAALRAPSLISLAVTVPGRAAHAGFAPEEGIHALWIMSQAISHIPQGRVDAETTLNIGTIQGGTATNIVPETCVCRGEIRSYCHEKALNCVEEVRRHFHEAVEELGGSFELETSVDLVAYETDASQPVVKHFQQACEKLGITCELTETFGGSDNNHFARQGIPGIVLSCGFREAHSVREYTRVQDLKLGAALLSALITNPQEK